MSFHSLFAQLKLLCNIAVAASGYDATDNFQFARRQAIGFVLGRRRCCALRQSAERVPKAAGPSVTDPVAARGNRANSWNQMIREGIFRYNSARVELEGCKRLLIGD